MLYEDLEGQFQGDAYLPEYRQDERVEGRVRPLGGCDGYVLAGGKPDNSPTCELVVLVRRLSAHL